LTVGIAFACGRPSELSEKRHHHVVDQVRSWDERDAAVAAAWAAPGVKSVDDLLTVAY
jgi:hypothetical protein